MVKEKLPTWILSGLVTLSLGLALLNYSAVVSRLSTLETEFKVLSTQLTKHMAQNDEETKSIYWRLYKMERRIDR